MSGQYRTICADPPWPFTWQGGSGGRRANATTLGYETMAYGDIARLGDRVAPAVADEASLLLWVTREAQETGEALEIALAWGFDRRGIPVIWNKPNFGAGKYPRLGHETCLVFHRGKGSIKADAPLNVSSVQTWSQPYGRGNGGKIHSAKPDGFYDFVETGFEGPYLELFARRARLGDWSYWGDQSLGTAQLPEAAA